jgi:integrase
MAKILPIAQQDRTQEGIRDFSILMLLASCGARDVEIASLRLNDVDWRMEATRIPRRKAGIASYIAASPRWGT